MSKSVDLYFVLKKIISVKVSLLSFFTVLQYSPCSYFSANDFACSALPFNL